MNNAIFAAVLTVAIVSGLPQQQQQQQHDDHNGHNHGSHEHHWVNVSVYYESLCPDSIKFFTQQLYPSLQGNLSNYINLTLVPFGKSKYTFDINQYEFTCHHGPAECEGNRLHLCAIKLIQHGKNTENLSYNKVTTAFINCLMDKVKPEGNKTTFPSTDCATINHVQNLNDIQNCANDVEGSRYLHMAGEQTEAFQNPLQSVPTIVFNNQYKQSDSQIAQSNFVKALCQYIQGEKPAECSKNSASKTHISAAIITAVALALAFASHL